MFDKMDMMLLMAKAKLNVFVDKLLHEEKGASDMVAIMVIIVILLAVAATFKKELEGLVQEVFGKATSWVKDFDTTT